MNSVLTLSVLTQICLTLNSNTFFVCLFVFYTRVSDLSLIVPSKVEYLHFCFDCLTDFSIVTECLPMSNEVHEFF